MVDLKKEIEITNEDMWGTVIASFILTMIFFIALGLSGWQTAAVGIFFYNVFYIAMKQNKQEDLDKKLQREASLKILNQK
jgi:hypothetical protein